MPPSRSASASASADLPLAVGPAMRMALEAWFTALTLTRYMQPASGNCRLEPRLQSTRLARLPLDADPSPSARCVPPPAAPPRSWRRPMTCSRAPRRASAPRASRGAFCTSRSPRSTSTRRSIPTTARSTPRRPRTSTAWSRPACSIRDAKPCYYVYRLTWRGRTQTGLAAVASVADYATNRIRKHELTHAGQGGRPRPPDRGGQRADRPGDDRLSGRAGDRRHAARAASAARPTVDVTADDGVRHQMWVIERRGDASRRSRAPSTRCRRSTSPTATTARPPPRASRRRAAASRGVARSFPRGDLSASRDDHPRLQPRGPRPQRPQRRSSCSPSCARISPSSASDEPVRPAASGEFGMYLAGQWYRLTIRPELIPQTIRSAGCRSRC